MNPNEINRVIAEYCGWTHGNLNDHEIMFKDRQSACVAQGRIHKQRIEMGIDPTRGTTPDYYNDLNAMHEAYHTLNIDEQIKFICILSDLVRGLPIECKWSVIPTDRIPVVGVSELLGAKASLLAEAFLRTIGKWKE
jgi:hypothetical protein